MIERDNLFMSTLYLLKYMCSGERTSLINAPEDVNILFLSG